ncbi:unnamed protein product [Adineta steineri]|uniref:Uncharacterized protein n=1 Tax=Adineta steineri TaxID=433720 RepID=A0A818ZG67_9BILA|nr:unnamed protein product [Adineta steineri]
MFYIISNNYLLQFILIFIYIFPTYTTIEPKLELVFLNGLNVIRCSDKQVQVYENSDKFLKNILTCDNKDDIYTPNYASFNWTELTLICASDDSTVHEEQIIKIEQYGTKYSQIPNNVESQLSRSGPLYQWNVQHDTSSQSDILKSDEQDVNNTYFDPSTVPGERRIYIWFPGNGIICRLIFTSNQPDPCPSMHNQPVNDVKYACYYNPGAEDEPTIEEMEAELEQVENEPRPPGTDTYVLDLNKPIIVPNNPGNSPQSNSNNSSQSNSNNSPQSNSNQQNNKLPFTPASQRNPPNITKAQETKSISKIIGLIFGILIIIALIGGIGFYTIRKYHLNKSVSLSSNLEDDNNKGLSSLAPYGSQQSLSTVASNDMNSELSIHVPSKLEKSAFERQDNTAANKRTRATSSMAFTGDI